jgi:hypothetical protein
MTALHSQSQRYYVALNEQRHYLALNEADEDVIDAAAARALPPITNALMLQEYMPTEMPSKLRKELAFLEGYVWFSEEKVNRAVKCCMAAVALIQTSGGDPADSGSKYQFFLDAIANLHREDVDMYHHDRALNAVSINGTGKPPQKYGEIPTSIPNYTTSGRPYNLVEKPFSWPSPVPDQVVDAVADFALKTPPDEFWIADYVLAQGSASYDPIVYARFGDWHVEVARWD